MLTTNSNPLALYIHWPFCKSKCPYCDFNSHVGSIVDMEQWRVAYIREIDYFADVIKGRNISSIFFGGGTPTLMAPFIAANIIEHLQTLTTFTPDIEITLEGNPTSVEALKLKEFKQAGVNRVSLGVQSLQAADLKFLGREHSSTEALQAIDTARNIFDNYSFDLIYARPNQTLNDWEAELTKALQFSGKHLSLYQLTIEKGTRFFSDYSKGAFIMPDEDLAADFYLLTRDIMQAHNMPAYEISNHAVEGFHCRHNMSYWHYDDYLGIGPGAHSRISKNGKKHAMMMTSQPELWLKAVAENNNTIQTNQLLDNEIVVDEAVMMGLRIRSGIDRNRFIALAGRDIEEVVNKSNATKLIQNGLIEIDDKALRCTDAGMLLVNRVALELLE